MSALRVLGLCYLATASLFALAIATADQARLQEALDSAHHGFSHQIGQSVIQPLLAFARAEDERFVDPPSKQVTIALDPVGSEAMDGYVPNVRQPPAQTSPSMIAPDLPRNEADGQAKAARQTPHALSVASAIAEEKVRTRLEQSLTPDLRANFDLFLLVSKAARGPAAQRFYVFKKEADGTLTLAYGWAASTGSEKSEITPHGRPVLTATPRGFYQFDPDRMYRRYTSHAWDQPMPFTMFFSWVRKGLATGLAIHAAVGDDLERLGKPASAGCVHISPEHAALLFDMVRADYRGRVPRFAYDERHETMNNRGEMAHDAQGHIEMMGGYRVLVDIEDFSGSSDTDALL